MTTLHIENTISDFPLWKSVFDQYAEMRRQSGVRRHRVLRPIDDPAYVVVDLDFDTRSEAEKFLVLLRTKIWSSKETAPALVGTAQARILDCVEER